MSPERVSKRQTGKLSANAFTSIIFPQLGASRSDIVVGPSHGVDVGIVDLGDGRVMALTSDPLFVAPELGWERAGWFAIQIVASDAVTSGLAPAYCTIDLNLPEVTTDAELSQLWTAIHAACTDIGMGIVTGHTGRYDSCAYPMLGGATVICVGERDRYVTPTMARPGDQIVITKGAAIEATALLAVAHPDLLARSLGAELARAAERLFWKCTVVPDALAATSVGVCECGVTCMHDATERGVWGGLYEIADAAGVGLLVDQSAIPVRPEVRAVCDLFNMDPYSASSEGTLLLTVRPLRLADVLARLRGAGIDARHVGEVTTGGQGVRVVRDAREDVLTVPTEDPFWAAFRRAADMDLS